MKILSFLGLFISKIKRTDIFNFPSVKYFDKRLSFLKIWYIWVKYCWNYRPFKLLFRFTRHNLQQPKNRQRKIAVTSQIFLFENCYWKKYLVKVLNFLTDWPENDGPWKFLQNWTENTDFAKFRNDHGCCCLNFIWVGCGSSSGNNSKGSRLVYWSECSIN